MPPSPPATVGKPWLSRRWRRALDLSLAAARRDDGGGGQCGGPRAVARRRGRWTRRRRDPGRRRCAEPPADAGGGRGRARWRRARRRAARRRAGRGWSCPAVPRGDGGRDPSFPKVYGQDSRDADLLYRSYRTAVLREPGGTSSARSRVTSSTRRCCCCSPSAAASPARRCAPSSPCPTARWCWPWRTSADRRLDELAAEDVGAALLDDVWRQVVALHAAGLSHGALRAANVLVTPAGRAVFIDLGAGTAAATARVQGDRPGRAARLARRGGRCRSRGRLGGARARGRRPGRGDALPPTARPVCRHPQGRLEVDAEVAARRDRRGDGARAGAAGAAGQGAAAHRRHDRHADRRVLRAAAAAGQRRRQHRRPRVGELVVARRRRGDVRRSPTWPPRSA